MYARPGDDRVSRTLASSLSSAAGLLGRGLQEARACAGFGGPLALLAFGIALGLLGDAGAMA